MTFRQDVTNFIRLALICTSNDLLIFLSGPKNWHTLFCTP